MRKGSLKPMNAAQRRESILNRLSEAKAEIDFKNLSASLSDLKVYLSLRQESPAYADIRENGGIGIPCFILEDGTVTRDLDTVLK